MAETNNGSVLSFNRDAGFLHRRAEARRDAGEQVEALRLYRRACDAAPGNVNYRIDLAEMLNFMGCLRASYDILSGLMNSGDISARTLKSGEVDSGALFGQACNLSACNFPASSLDFMNMLGKYPRRDADDSEAHELMTHLVAMALMVDHEHCYRRTLELMCRLSDMGEGRRAIAVARRYFRRNPDSDIAHAFMAWAAMLRADQPEAMEHLVEALAMKQQNPWVLSIAARILNGGERGQAQPALHSAFELSDEPGCDLLIMRQAVGLGMDSLVLDVSARLLEQFPRDPRITAYNAAAMINTGLPARQAAGALRKALEVWPDDITLTHYLNLINARRPDSEPLLYPDREMLGRWAAAVSGMRVRLMAQECAPGAFASDGDLMRLLEWGLYYNDTDISSSSVALLMNIGGERAREILWRFLNDYERPDEFRLNALKLMSGANFPLPRYVFLYEHVRRMDRKTLCRMLLADETRPEIRAAARRLRKYPTAIITLRALMFFADAAAVKAGVHLMTNALECAYRVLKGESISLRAVAIKRELNCADFTRAVYALLDAAHSQEENI